MATSSPSLRWQNIDLDLNNVQRPQPLPDALRSAPPTPRAPQTAQTAQAAPQRPDLRTNFDSQLRNPGMANPQAQAAYSEMRRNTARPVTPTPTPSTSTAQSPGGSRDFLRDAGRRIGSATASGKELGGRRPPSS